MIKKTRLVPANRRVWLGCIASCLLVGLGCLAVHRGNNFGWFVIVLFGLGILAPLILLRPGSAWLELDEERFTLCLSFKPDRYLWSDITEIGVWRGVVSFKIDSEHRGNKRGQTTARAISGYDGSIPNIFPLPPQALLELMTEFWQNQKLRAPADPPG